MLGIEDDREVLTFIDGDVAVDPQWEPGHAHRLPPYARTDLALRGAADLLRQLHTAASGYARLRTFIDAYGLTDRKAILPALERSMTGAAGRPTNVVDAASLQWLQGASMRLAGAL